MTEPLVLFQSHLDGQSFRFTDLCDVICVSQIHDVGPALDRVEKAVGQGLHATGYLSYEAAGGLDPALKTHDCGDVPLVWFGIFRNREGIEEKQFNPCSPYTLNAWTPSISRPEYDDSLARIREYIIAGDTYQVNYSFRLRSEFAGDAEALYRDLCRAQRTDYAAYLDLGRFQILSASPELFFSLKNGILTTRPMKGTWSRGRSWAEDERCVEALQNSKKNRAENVMIVDLLRNDLGKVSKAGSVDVAALWDVERYETVLQMTSTVTSQVRPGVGLRDLMTALFPCGSITGAPKVRTMEIIREVEDSPRGVYTGCIGYISPDNDMAFNVAIRTVCIDRETGIAEFGVGGGITYDSSSDGEYEECVTKARLLGHRSPDFDLFETLRYDGGCGFFLLDRHLDRLQDSARYFGFYFDRAKAKAVLETAVGELGEETHRVRLTLSRRGCLKVETARLETPEGQQILQAGFSSRPIDQNDSLYFHKTTHREPYVSRLANHPDWDEVILVNTLGEVTECTIGNVVVNIDDCYFTPPVSCGLLGGTFRAELLVQKKIQERVLSVEDVKRADAVYMINSVREWVALKLAD